jgi:hypothetical protein
MGGLAVNLQIAGEDEEALVRIELAIPLRQLGGDPLEHRMEGRTAAVDIGEAVRLGEERVLGDGVAPVGLGDAEAGRR